VLPFERSGFESVPISGFTHWVGSAAAGVWARATPTASQNAASANNVFAFEGNERARTASG
jgi:hypothetical protein